MTFTRVGDGEYLGADGATRLVGTDDGWEIRQSGEVLADGIPTLEAAKRRAAGVKRRRVRDLRTKLQAELAEAEKALGSVTARKDGTWYDAKGLDTGVRLKREFAVAWRGQVLGHEGVIRQRKIQLVTGLGKFRKARTYYVFAVDGKDQVAVCKSAGPQYKQRLLNLGGQSFNNYCRREGWVKVR